MFGPRFRICRLAGIPVEIDASWFLIALFLTWSLAAGYFPYTYPGLASGTYWIMGLSGMVGLFLSIVLHELGHAVTARKYRLPVARITLFIFGGVAELKKEPSSPFSDFIVALMGPVVSVVLALLFYLGAQTCEAGTCSVLVHGVLYYLAMINIFIVAFNLIPAFPLDGGRILRSILWAIKKDIAWATGTSAQLGAAFGLVLFFFGILHLFSKNPLTGIWLIIVGLFLQRAALQARSRVYVSKSLKGEKVQSFMKTDIDMIDSRSTVQDCIELHIYKTHHHLYPVVSEGKLSGYVTLETIKNVPKEDRDRVLIETLSRPLNKELTISPGTDASEALLKLGEAPFPTLFVLEGDKPVGLLTAHDLLKIVSIKLELEGMQRF